MRTIFTSIFILFLCFSGFGQNTLRQITFINLLPHTEYLVSVYLDGRPHWAKIPPGKSDKGMVSFPVYEWTEKITVSVSPAWESDDKVLTPKGGGLKEMECVQYYSPFVWDVYPSCSKQTCITFYLNNEKMPRP